MSKLTRPMLPVIQSLWIGENLTQVEKLCIQSFLDHGHEFHLYTYSNIGGIPKGATVKDGNAILPKNEIFQHKRGSYAIFSDYFRYAMLAKNGGFWVDMDIICAKPFDFNSDIVLAMENGTLYTNAVIGIPPHHTLMITLEQICRDYKNKARSSWGAMGGPAILTRLIREFGMEKYGRPFIYFCPIGVQNWVVAFDNSFRHGIQFYPDTYAVHLWNEAGRRTTGFDKNAQFDPESLFEQLKTKHGIAPVKNASRIRTSDLSAMSTERQVRKQTERRRRKQRKWLMILGIIAILLPAFYLFSRLCK